MEIAIVGGGASGMATAYLLQKNGHRVTVLEKQSVLGGHIRTLNQNVVCTGLPAGQVLEAGVLEFPRKFVHFIALMDELGVTLEPVEVGSALYQQDGESILSARAIERNLTGLPRQLAYLKLDEIFIESIGLWTLTHFSREPDLYDQPLSRFLGSDSRRDRWLKLLIMYSYSMPFHQIGDFPAWIAIPTLRDYMLGGWLRIRGGVYTYIEKILERFRGEVWTGAQIAGISRSAAGVQVQLAGGGSYRFDRVVFATPPDQVLQLLRDPTPAEIRCFAAWQPNLATTCVHTDTALYGRYGIERASEFDFFQLPDDWGYNAGLNQMCALPATPAFHLAFRLQALIDPRQILHVQEHHTPLYTVQALRHRQEVLQTNGTGNTFHVGAYLGDGLHEGAIASACRVAAQIGVSERKVRPGNT